MKKKVTTPCTEQRHATEKMPPEMKTKAMVR